MLSSIRPLLSPGHSIAFLTGFHIHCRPLQAQPSNHSWSNLSKKANLIMSVLPLPSPLYAQIENPSWGLTALNKKIKDLRGLVTSPGSSQPFLLSSLRPVDSILSFLEGLHSLPPPGVWAGYSLCQQWALPLSSWWTLILHGSISWPLLCTNYHQHRG